MIRGRVTTPPNIKHWTASESNRKRLQELLDDPVLREAAALLAAAGAPNYQSLGTPEKNNQRLCWYAGYCDFFRDLERLTAAPTGPNKQRPDEWTHIQPNPH